VSAVDRPEPPAELTPEQRLVWVRVVNSLPADWFGDETHGVLAQYCRHVVAGNHVAQMVCDMERKREIDVDSYDKLLKMQERESRISVSLATKLRITPQSTYDKEKVKHVNKVTRPWED
jgi:hypothetical protein